MLRIGKLIDLNADPDVEVLQEIPVGNYVIELDAFGKAYLVKESPFKLPEKLYGDCIPTAERYINTFRNRDRNLGVLLTGEKGSGKSLLARTVCNKAGLPVIIIDRRINGFSTSRFLRSITQEVVIFFDEFEKIFSENRGEEEVDEQEEFLSLLDGLNYSKKLFLFTCNNSFKINDFLKNRPGRIHYLKQYHGLDLNTISDVIDDLLVNKDYTEGIKRCVSILGGITMDMLFSLIEEMNMYNEDAPTAINHLNIRPTSSSFDFSFKYKGTTYTGSSWSTHPLATNRLQVVLDKDDNGRAQHVLLENKEGKYEILNDTIILKNVNVDKYSGVDVTFVKKDEYNYVF